MISLPVLTDERRPLVDELSPFSIAQALEEQRSMTAVEQFSDWHGHRNGHAAVARRDRSTPRYKSLLPATPPGPGQQYAFEVDLDRCSGCKSCVVACHTLNGLDEGETWRDVGLLIGGAPGEPVLQHVTTACHHCLQPACMIACPVNAYEKDPVTGIVKHLDDQCIGCQYCTMACSYEVPKYLPSKGIVRKCDMCSSRLAVGEAPACVQACPDQAITIRIIDMDQVADDAEASHFLPAAPDPQITLPTTVYKTRRPFPRNLLPADYLSVHRQHAHWSLLMMLVLTQLSVGAFCVAFIVEQFLHESLVEAVRAPHAMMAVTFGLLALGASLFHLGRPHLAFRAVLGLRHSWLSREIVAFGLFAFLATIYAGSIRRAQTTAATHSGNSWEWTDVLGATVVVCGVMAVFCSAMVYVFTQRECWSIFRVAMRFTLTSAILGTAAVWLTILALAMSSPSGAALTLIQKCGPALCATLIGAAGVKLVFEAVEFRHLWRRRMTPLKRSSLLMTRDLSNATLARFALGAFGGLLLPSMLLGEAPTMNDAETMQFVVLAGLVFIACLAGELLERYLFFAACAAPRMPGGIR